MSSQGHGVAGRYLGASDAAASLEASEIVVLPIPFDKTTTYQKGTNLGPAALIEASRNLEVYDIETKMEPHLLGIHTAEAIDASNSAEMIQAAYEKTLFFLKQGKFVVALGGEHSISQAVIRAHAEVFGPITVLQCDAHTDLVPAYEGDPFSHASVMARVKEVEKVSHIVSVGIRSMSPEEKPLLNLSHTFFAGDLHDDEDWMDKVVQKLSDRVYISFDLDVFDSSLMPSTGTPEPGGLFWHQVTKLLKKVAQKKQIVGFDVVELCPIPGLKAPDYLAAKLVYKLLCYIMRKK